MAAIKLSRSGKAVQFIDDDGRVFQTSTYDYSLLLSGQKTFITPVRLPHDVNSSRFPASPMLVPRESVNGEVKWEKVVVEKGVRGGSDAYDLKKEGERQSNKLKELTEW